MLEQNGRLQTDKFTNMCAARRNYTTEPGKRINSVRYKHDGYLYTKAVELKSGWSLRCVNSRLESKCRGTATLDLVNDIVVSKVAHNHDEMDAEQDVVRFA